MGWNRQQTLKKKLQKKKTYSKKRKGVVQLPPKVKKYKLNDEEY